MAALTASRRSRAAARSEEFTRAAEEPVLTKALSAIRFQISGCHARHQNFSIASPPAVVITDRRPPTISTSYVTRLDRIARGHGARTPAPNSGRSTVPARRRILGPNGWYTRLGRVRRGPSWHRYAGLGKLHLFDSFVEEVDVAVRQRRRQWSGVSPLSRICNEAVFRSAVPSCCPGRTVTKTVGPRNLRMLHLRRSKACHSGSMPGGPPACRARTSHCWF